MRISFREMIEWIESNRVGKKCFIGDRPSLEQYILNKARNKMMLYSVDSDSGTLNGIVTYNLVSSASVIFVENILTTHKQAIRDFIRKLRELYPTWSVQGNREHRGIITYNQIRLVNLIEEKL